VSDHRKRVLFVCVGNSCRSQMAEGFARALGDDVVIPASAGLAPALGIAPDTVRAMAEKDILLGDHFPKSLRNLARIRFDVVVNMSQRPLGRTEPDGTLARTVEWEIPDPVGMTYEEHCEIRDAIERKVVELIGELRAEPRPLEFRGQGSGRVPL
jgi:protein-tyrosine-phosphatase